MRSVAVLAAGVLMAAGCGGAGAGRGSSTHGLVAIGAGLQGRAGLTASVYARGLPKASDFALDAQGRLWVATADYVDHGKDGVYLVPEPGAAPVEVIPGLHTPLGLLWYRDSLYVASTGSVDQFSGFSGGKFATRRPIVTLPAGVGESNEIALAPNGRMAMGISAPCDHCTPASKWSAAVVSFRPDGSDLRIEASGIRAPVGLLYDGADLLVTMNQRDDLGAQTPGDWLAIVKPGQAWGFPNCYGQGGVACAGRPGPTAVLDKHGAVIGLAVVTGQLGPKVGTAVLVAEWAAGKVQQVALKTGGPPQAASVTPFLLGVKNPVPLLLSPDGVLLVGDWATGTVYSISKR